MVARNPRAFRLGALTEDDLDEDYVPGRSEKTMSAAHVASLDRLVEQTREAAARIRKSAPEKIVIVLEPE